MDSRTITYIVQCNNGITCWYLTEYHSMLKKYEYYRLNLSLLSKNRSDFILTALHSCSSNIFLDLDPDFNIDANPTFFIHIFKQIRIPLCTAKKQCCGYGSYFFCQIQNNNFVFVSGSATAEVWKKDIVSQISNM